jgi:DNA-binding transcriptional ArsR family regulator
MTDVLPSARYELAGFGELAADPSRAAMLLSLMDGSARRASELAGIAGVTPQTASSHLRRLVEGGLLVLERLGRHHYFRLSGERVAEALEAVALLHPPARKRVPPTPERVALAEARTCYLHLAGRLGVAWLATLEKRRFIHLSGGALAMTGKGVAHFASLRLSPSRWPAGKPCLDWTERRSHLGGPLGGLLTQHLFERGWLARRAENRAVRVTSLGARGLALHFSLRWP